MFSNQEAVHLSGSVSRQNPASNSAVHINMMEEDIKVWLRVNDDL